MKAYFTDVVNGESRLVAKDIDMPKPADDEILIKVKATALKQRGFYRWWCDAWRIRIPIRH